MSSAARSGGGDRRGLRPASRDDLSPIVDAKLAAPRVRSGLVDRPRLLEQFDGGTPSLILVDAPVGYGKTTAGVAWCASRNSPVAWVTLDVLDNDPARLWSYVATAANRVRDGLGRGTLARLQRGGWNDGAVVEVMNGLASFGDEIVVVLDDLHVVTDTECLATIDYAIEALPANVRLVLLSRTKPALHLARHRATGALAELIAADLAFTEAETAELLVQRAGLDLSADDVTLLHERTEGWPAALWLAALWLRGIGDRHSAVRAFGGDQRFVADYLTAEVVAALDDDTRAFVLATAVLGRFDAALCDQVLGRADSAARLAELEQSNLFLTRLEPGALYRMHSLFADFAAYQLAARSPGAVASIHLAAATAHRAAHRPIEAAEHAAAAGDHAMAADLILEHHLPLLRSGRSRTLLHWARTLPDETLVERPALAAAGATAAATLGGHTVVRRRLLVLADRGIAAGGGSDVYARAVAAMIRAVSIDGGVADAVASGRLAVELAAREAAAEPVWVAAHAALARALYFAGEPDASWRAAFEAISHPEAERRAPGYALALTTLALVAVDRSRLASARAHAERARGVLGGVSLIRTWLGGNAAAAVGCVLLAEHRLPEAERELARAHHAFQDEVATVHEAWVLVLLARVRCLRGRLEEAQIALLEARAAIAEIGDVGQVTALADEVGEALAERRHRAAGEVLVSPSDAELAVLRLLATDASMRQIGAQLFISPNTVRSHTRALYRKLGVGLRADAVARGETLGLLPKSQSPM